MTRLTNAVKSQITKSWVDEKWLTKLKKSLDSLNADVKIQAEDQMKIGIDIYQNNIEIRPYLKSKNYLEGYNLQEKINSCEYINQTPSSINCISYASESHYSAANFDTKTKGSIKAIKRHNDVIIRFNNELESIRGILNSVTTVKRLSDLLPDIEKYLPEVTKGTMLVSTDCLVRTKAAL
tara:strand:+ start:90 stop:629 length:540 start_codon:yes stop_codon:yes gene_type:complete